MAVRAQRHGAMYHLGRVLRLGLVLFVIGILAGLGSALFTRSCYKLIGGADAYDLAIVLSAGMTADGQALGPVTASRTRAGATLYNAGVVDRLAFTGEVPWAQVPMTSLMREQAMEEGVPASAITVEPESLSTLENALFTRPLAAQADSVLVITTGFHAWRSAASMRWAGVEYDAFCKSAPFDSGPVNSLRTLVMETLKWYFNILRASLWSLAGGLGVQDMLPRGILH